MEIKNSKKRDNGQLNYLMRACTQEGSHVSKIPTTFSTMVTKCRAKIIASKGGDGVWSIKRVVLDHYHELSPIKVRMIKISKSINKHDKRTIKLNDEARGRINKTFQTIL